MIFGFGMIYAFLIPPFEAPDEPAHFARAYGIAEGQFILKDHPRQLLQYLSDEIQKRYPGQDIAILMSIRQLLNKHQDRISNIAYNSSQYSPVPYLFHAVILKIMMMYSTPINLQFSLYASRIVSILLFSCLMYIILKVSRNMAWPFFWIAMTPMALSQASIVNPDGIVFCAATILLLVSIHDVQYAFYAIWMVVSAFLLISTKSPYAPLLLVPLITLFQDNRIHVPKLVWLIVAVIISSISFLCWTYFVKTCGIYELMMSAILKYNSPAIDPHRQFELLLQSPFNLCRIVFNTLSLRGGVMLHEFVGVLGWQNTPVPRWVVMIWCFLSLFAVFISARPTHISYTVSLGWGIASIVSAILAYLCVTIAVYLVWMPVGASFVYLQGRYFHPIAAALCIAVILMKPFTMNYGCKRLAPIIFPFFSIIIHTATYYILLKKYYHATIF
jgi:hypothetical protein